MTPLQAALSYATRGWPVFPVHSIKDGRCTCGKTDCGSPGKHPVGKLVPKGLLDSTTDTEIIKGWWTACPWANVAIATGQCAGFFVLDVDADKGGADSLVELQQEYGPLPDTAEALTGGGGHHILFAWPTDGPAITNAKGALNDWPGLDVRGNGGYIIAAPSLHKSGRCYTWELSADPLDGAAIAPAPDWLLRMIRNQDKPGTPRSAPVIGDRIPDGQRNATLTSLAGSMRRRGASEEAIFAALQVENQARCVPPLNDDELRAIARSVARYQPETQTQAPASTHTETPEELPEPMHLTDLGNAKRLVWLHGHDMRYCHSWGRWLIWDGKRWALDTSGAAERLAKDCVRQMYTSASRIEDEALRKTIVKHALKSESQRAISAMLALAQSEEGISVQPAELDANPWLLNVQNGTIDLRTGELREHRREDLLTKISPVTYDANARSELWERFLEDSTGGDHELQVFLQRAAGYSLTGETDEEKLFFVHGPGAAGKSTFLEALKATFGDYAATADFETFLARHQVGGPRSDVAQLAGARLVVGIEVDEGKKMAEGLVKQLTGGDTVTARFLYKENFTFRPQMKLWLAANHAPKVSDDDDAMWRRILRVPFEHVVLAEKRDPGLKRTLRDTAISGPAILAWAVEGCLRWQREGLRVPPVVTQATQAYRLDNDPLRDFLNIRCVFGPTKTVRIRNLGTAYKTWCTDNGEIPISVREFNRRLQDRGCKRAHTMKGDIWVGIGLAAPDGDDDNDEGNEQNEHAEVKVELVSSRVDTLPAECSFRSLCSSENDKDPTDSGLWEPPEDIQQQIEEVFSHEAVEQ